MSAYRYKRGVEVGKGGASGLSDVGRRRLGERLVANLPLIVAAIMLMDWAASRRHRRAALDDYVIAIFK